MPNASQMVGMSLQQYVHASPLDGNLIVLKVDVSNAFNSVTREALLYGAQKHFPAAFDWLRFCCTQHCPLYHQGQTLMSKRRVHRGDPMGPVAFAFFVHDANCGCRPLDSNVVYLDDGILVGNTMEVFQALEHLVSAYQVVGLQYNVHKCTIWGPGV